MHKRVFSFIGLAVLASITLATPALAEVNMSWRSIGNPGNPADPITGYGSVNHAFKIGTYEVTNAQYAEFLNAKGASNDYGIYNDGMWGYGIIQNGSPGSFSYSVTSGFENKPVVYVTWFDAARFANWLGNGQGNASTETGAYTLNGAMTGIIPVNPGASVYLPSENEWYKAAFYNPATSTYSVYANGQNSITTADANYLGEGSKDVGSYIGDASFYGTFDQNGNVWEWNDGPAGSSRGLIGGSFNSNANPLQAGFGGSSDPNSANNEIGFRVAGIAEAVTGITVTFNSATDVGVTASSYTASGTATLTLGYAPATGTELMVVKNTGLGFIAGNFSNLTQGQSVALSHGGVTYDFVANYYGGTGNDLVLVWKNNRPLAWGWNNKGQLGNNSMSDNFVPAPIINSGVVSGKTVLSVAAGRLHSLALCSDGTLAAWGYNYNGQLGNNSTTDSLIPVAVDTSGVLAGKTVVAIAAGDLHSMALCSDGTVATWGYNSSGQLGNSSTTDSPVPVVVGFSGAPLGKPAVAIAAGYEHSVALCADGTVAAWGLNSFGQLGNNSTADNLTPVQVSTGVTLSGKTVVAVAAGKYHSLAACSDGTVAAWGRNDYGQLGNNTTTNSPVPVAVDNSAVLSGKTVTDVKAGSDHSVALCSDGTMAAWGANDYGQLGDNSTTESSVPVAVDTSGVLSGKTVMAIAAGSAHSMALCSDGTLAAWGYNGNGQLGDNSTTESPVPVAVNTNTLAAGERFTKCASNARAFHTLALVAVPPVSAVTPPIVANPTFANVTATVATLGGNVTSDGGSAITERGVVFSKTSDNADPVIGGTGVTKVTASGTTGVFTVGLSGLSAGTGYSFKAYATNSAGTSYTSPAATFTTTLSASQTWRQTWFGTTENAGDAADTAAPDGDGIENLLKYALVLQPGVSAAASLPVAQPRSYAEGERLSLVFTRDPARNDITIEIQVSDSPSGPWTTVAISVNGAPFTGSGYVGETDAGGGLKTVEVRDVVNIADAPARFMRILVTR